MTFAQATAENWALDWPTDMTSWSPIVDQILSRPGL
jgi:hypothetical protein